jgi:gliding motility-associated lipoprotein GldD
MFFSCGDNINMPKKRMYPLVEYPLRKEVEFINKECPFHFKHSDYLKYRRDTSFFGEKPINDCWFDLHSKELNSSIHCSFHELRNRKDLDSLIMDAFTLTDKHNIKANARKESIIDNKNGIKGILFEVDGPVASPIQFYVTDSLKYFFRGSLYFNSTVNPDSTAPVLTFIREDVKKLIETFNWKNKK